MARDATCQPMIGDMWHRGLPRGCHVAEEKIPLGVLTWQGVTRVNLVRLYEVATSDKWETRVRAMWHDLSRSSPTAKMDG